MCDTIQHPITIPMEDPIIHTDERPFCAFDPFADCPCHEDPILIDHVADQVTDGLTPSEATRVVTGRQCC
ncbi:MAG: hypothetical protein JO183_01615 [Ktedonobacteraceae bacterium]|nr:hypothetical protein [Ktedonobacteraceae bacterium]MBV8821226.1 hypothetical protein [Ktedonobacteraceae bacterium]MBV9021157.1 hypothetical protein [Ktedonobacteraceae bacterium]